jgi:hypothetical protein
MLSFQIHFSTFVLHVITQGMENRLENFYQISLPNIKIKVKREEKRKK